jgi:hypothetical protein
MSPLPSEWCQIAMPFKYRRVPSADGFATAETAYFAFQRPHQPLICLLARRRGAMLSTAEEWATASPACDGCSGITIKHFCTVADSVL